MIISIGTDHTGFQIKENLVKHLKKMKYIVKDNGTFSEESCDYPDYAHTVCEQILEEASDFGILICGTGIGMSICANRMEGIRAALCTNEFMAEKARRHNNANILVLGAKINDEQSCKKMLDIFLSEKFDGGRHTARLKKIS